MGTVERSNRNNGNRWHEAENQPSQVNEIFSLIKSVAIFLAIALLLRASVVEAFKIPSSSMEPTLQIGDHILVNKLSYGIRLPLIKESIKTFRLPTRGDVVVFTLPDDLITPEVDESDTNIIKRVIGLPGDIIELRGMNLYVNGALVPDEHSTWHEGGRKDFGPIMVPEGRVLLFGDNRDHSKDSRYWHDPFLDVRRIKGKAFFIYWSWHEFTRMFSVIE